MTLTYIEALSLVKDTNYKLARVPNLAIKLKMTRISYTAWWQVNLTAMGRDLFKLANSDDTHGFVVDRLSNIDYILGSVFEYVLPTLFSPHDGVLLQIGSVYMYYAYGIYTAGVGNGSDESLYRGMYIEDLVLNIIKPIYDEFNLGVY